MITQRRWYYTGRRLALGISKRRRRAFLALWDTFYEAWAPLRSMIFWAQNPRLYIQVQRAIRLRRMGRAEVAL